MGVVNRKFFRTLRARSFYIFSPPFLEILATPLLSLPPADNQWYKSGSGEGDKGKDDTDGGVDGDDDQSLKTPPPLPPALQSLPPADNQWYKGDDGASREGVMAMTALMVE